MLTFKVAHINVIKLDLIESLPSVYLVSSDAGPRAVPDLT